MSIQWAQGGRGGDGPVSKLLEAWEQFERIEKGRSARGVAVYRRAVSSFLAWAASRPSPSSLVLEELTRRDVSDWLRDLYLSQGNLAGSTRANKLSGVRSFFRFLLREKVIFEDPTSGIPSPKAQKKTPTKFTTDELRVLFASPDLETLLGIRDLAILKTLYAAGLRASEMSGLNLSDVVDHGRTMVVLKIRGKGDKERQVPLDRDPSETLKRWISFRVTTHPVVTTSPVFCQLRAPFDRLGVRGLQEMLKRYAARVGISSPEAFLHKFRATWASDLYDSGMNKCLHCGRTIRRVDLFEIMILAGWSSLETAKRYISISDHVLRKTRIPSGRWRDLAGTKNKGGADGGEH